jgi:hypothetical protein
MVEFNKTLFSINTLVDNEYRDSSTLLPYFGLFIICAFRIFELQGRFT